MNVGIDISSLLSGQRTGVGEYTFELLQALFTLDKKNQYFLFYNSFSAVDFELPWEQKNVHLISTRYPNKLFHFVTIFFRRPFLDTFIVRRYEKKHKVKIGHIDIFFSPNIGFSFLSKKCKKILMVHDLSFELFPECFSLKMWLWHRLLRPKKQCEYSDVIIVPSKNTKRDVAEVYKIPEEKVQVLYPGVSSTFNRGRKGSLSLNQNDDPHFRMIKEKYKLPDKYIFFLGTIEPRKNIETIIEAYKLSSLTDGGCSLIIAGAKGWKYKNILKLIANTRGVEYVGYVNAEDKPWLYELAEFFVYPSLYEGFGLPVLEAMHCGLPAITSSRSSLPEITSGAAYLVDPRNINDIRQAMERLYTSQTLKIQLREQAKEQMKKFQWPESARQFLSFLNVLIRDTL